MLTQTFSEIWNRMVSRPKLQRSLSEAAEVGDKDSIPYWIHKRGSNPCEVDEYGYFPLLNASLNNKLEMAKALIAVGADVNQKGPHGYTALHAAAQNGLRDIVELLIQSGAELDPRNDDNDTPLLLATRAQQIEVIALLNKAGCDATARGYHKESSIDLAREEGLGKLADCLESRIIHKQDGTDTSHDDSEIPNSGILLSPTMSHQFKPDLVGIAEESNGQ